VDFISLSLIFECLGTSEENYARNLASQSVRLGFRYLPVVIIIIVLGFITSTAGPYGTQRTALLKNYLVIPSHNL